MNLALKKYESKIGLVLFLLILIPLIPFFICFTLLDNPEMLQPLLSFAYVLQLIIFISFIYSSSKNHFPSIILALIFACVQLISIILNSYLGIQYNNLDFINILSRAINFALFFGVIYMCVTNEKQIIIFLKYLLNLTMLACAYNIISNAENILLISNITNSYHVDFKSFFVNRNQFGSFLMVSLIAQFYLWHFNEVKKIDYLKLLFIIVNIILTLSRGAFITTIVFLAVYFFINRGRRSLYLFLSCLLVLFLFIVMTNVDLNNIFEKLIRVESGYSGRIGIWQMGIDVANINLISGVGYFTGLEIAQFKGFVFDQFHSIYIDSLVSGGFLELTMLVFLLVFMLVKVISSNLDRNLKSIYISSLIGVMFLGVFESVSFFSIGFVDSLYTIFFISLPLLLMNSKIENKNT